MVQDMILIDRKAEPNPEFEILEPPTTTETLDLSSIVPTTTEPITIPIRAYTSFRKRHSPPLGVNDHVALLSDPVSYKKSKLPLIAALAAILSSLGSVALITLSGILT